MFLGNPSLPLEFPVNEALSKVNGILTKKNWHNFEVGNLKMVLVPYFFFHYHYYIESENKEESKKVIEKSFDGYLALNGVTLEMEKNSADLIKKYLKKLSNEAPSMPFEEKETLLEKKECEKVIRFKSAEHFKIPKENILISSIKKVFFPLYETFIEVNKQNFEIVINATNGEVLGIGAVPEREKGFLELTKETLTELSEPKAWLTYSKGLFTETGKAIGGKAKNATQIIPKISEKKSLSSIFSSNWFLFLIIILALFLIYLALFV